MKTKRLEIFTRVLLILYSVSTTVLPYCHFAFHAAHALPNCHIRIADAEVFPLSNSHDHLTRNVNVSRSLESEHCETLSPSSEVTQTGNCAKLHSDNHSESRILIEHSCSLCSANSLSTILLTHSPCLTYLSMTDEPLKFEEIIPMAYNRSSHPPRGPPQLLT